MCNIDIQASYKSDQYIILMSLLMNNFKRGCGIWKLNINLLKDKNYVKIVNDCMLEEKQRYAVSLYDFIIFT